MALTLGTSPSAFTPVPSGPSAATVTNPGDIPSAMMPMQNVLGTLPQAGYKSLADFSLEYAMYLLLNVSFDFCILKPNFAFRIHLLLKIDHFVPFITLTYFMNHSLLRLLIIQKLILYLVLA